MKKILIAFALIILIILSTLLCSCGTREEISRQPIDCYHTEETSQIVAEYQYRYLRDKWMYLPTYKTEIVPPKYHILYLITSSDESTAEEWVTVDKETYDAFIKGEG